MVLNEDGGSLRVVVTATGRVVGQLRRPVGQAFVTIVGTAGDRRFFVVADLSAQSSCQAFFYQFSLSADGVPSALTPLPVRRLPGLPTALAASADGSLVAYSVVHCASGSTGNIGSGQPIGQIGLIDLRAGKITRRWSYTAGEDYTNDLSMSADGTLLGYSNYLGATPVGRVLTASALSGQDQRHSRIVVHQPLSTALSASSRLMYALTGARDHVLAAYDTANGQQVKVLHTWPAASQPGRLVADPAGRYALLPITVIPKHHSLTPAGGALECRKKPGGKGWKCNRTTPPETLFVSVNLATGAVTKLPFREPLPAGWGMVAW
jgi:hypothetical protein